MRRWNVDVAPRGNRQISPVLLERNPSRCAVLAETRETVENLPTILVVEDDPLIQNLVEDALTDGGFEIVMASSSEDAIDLLDVGNVDYRAVVTDINLGRDKLTGWDVARHAREIDAGFPVVYMTGANADEWASKGVPNSILLSKPFAQAQLLTAVSQLLSADGQTA
jgi:DNA-binding response OmpR family regulator